jgi:DUF4097 and DUF4098 domain-containing protein YvlB
MEQIVRAVIIGILISLAWTAAGAQERERQTAQTDQTVPATRGTRLTINNFAGEVVVTTWDRDTVRVQARHSARDKVHVQTTAAGIVIQSRSSAGVGSFDYEITAPAWMPVKVDGTYNFVSIEGAQSEVSAQTVRGDIVIKGGTGFVTARSIEGEVIVEGARGRINVSSVNEGIRITGASGDIVAETTNGSIRLSSVEARSVEVATINGDVTYSGIIVEGGRYRFTSHNGDITLAVPETTNATFSVRTHNGDFRSTLPVKAVGEPRRGRRATYTLGTGRADVEVESFGGRIRVRAPGGAAPGTKDKGKDPDVQREYALPLVRGLAPGVCQPSAISAT